MSIADEGSSRIGDTRPAGGRECGICTACCDGWLRITIDNEPVEPGKKCKYSAGTRCTIYEKRPIDPCRKFVCGWLAPQSPLPTWMRPDLANVIFLARYFYWHDLPVDVAVPVAEGIDPKAMHWMKAFAVTRRRLLIYRVDEDWYALGPPAFQTDMAARFSKGEDVLARRA